ncbi:proline-rich protein PRCC [Hetaerina americana]|uniref:proline-rich protein PRCC n=1 Tax=Hetaerina americana TaxID=62018 RepID=UPI003A7F44F0
MSLVAYDNSDISSDEEEVENKDTKLSQSKSCAKTESVLKNVSDSQQSDRKVDSEETDSPNFSSALPKPIKNTSSLYEEDITKRLMFSSFPSPKTSGLVSTSGNKSGESIKSRNLPTIPSSNPAKRTVKITLPSLSEFIEDDEESKPKKLKPSSKGSGLFALLPAPKNLVVKENNRKLIPRVVSKPPPKTSVPVHANKKNKAEALINYPDSGEESGEEEKQIDFFSLSSSARETVCPNPTADFPNEILNINQIENPLTEVGTSSTYSETLPSSSIHVLSPQKTAEHADATALPEASNEENDLQLDDDAIHRLCGRRGRDEIIDAQVIDVCGETHLPDPKEWLTKQFTEEQETRSHSHRKRDGPTTQQRRKHQITYLAFQAKERELELKNQWAQNKMSRKQTQAKYGF